MTKQASELYEFGPFRVDPREYLVSRDGEPLALTPKAFETLLVLVQNNGHLMLKDDLMKALWPDSYVEEVNLSQNISMLRKALGDTPQNSRYIVTVPGKGYRFVGEVRTLAAVLDCPEEVIVASRSRTRVVIEEKVVEDDRETMPLVPVLDPVRYPALPGEVAGEKRRWISMVLLAIVATAIGALGAWVVLGPLPTPRMLRHLRLTHSGQVSPLSRVLSDGSRLYFTETVGGAGVLAQIPVNGGDPSEIPSSVPNIALHDIDNTKSRVLITAQGSTANAPLWVLPTSGGSAQRIGDIVASDFSWSADGRRIIYCRDGSMYAAAPDGTQTQKLLSVRGIIEVVRESPDGQRLRFSVEDRSDGGRSLWEAFADGSNPHPMSFGWKAVPHAWGEGELGGDWTPDGKYFVFRVRRDNIESLWALREKAPWPHNSSGPPVQIYTTPDRMGEPRFSADGTRLFFSGYREEHELVRYDNERHLFVPYLGGIPARLLSFSPDGQWVVYRNDIDGTLWRSRLDGSEKLQLTFSPMFAMHSSWSPDGRIIVFQASVPGGPSKLYTIPMTGGKEDLLLEDQEASIAAPSWCGNNRGILFMRWATNTTGGRGSGVAVFDSNTRQSRILPGTEGFDGVHCSPDGNFAAASDQINHKLMLYDFVTDHWSPLTDGTPYGWGIRWSADSHYVYYQHADEEEEQPIFRVRISDRKAERITSSRQLFRADVLDYTMTGLTNDNSPLASLVRRNSDVYALELDLP